MSSPRTGGVTGELQAETSATTMISIPSVHLTRSGTRWGWFQHSATAPWLL
ncbi:MAG: hypothetical protein QOJ51_3862 [Acidobacteriaceae bacterium]|jgi:hypothetical protein|nr:hypothetical protein [Acidobacteriaceae bacterium]